MTPAILRCGDRTLTLDRPHVMGILNVTPDSFSDGGLFTRPVEAVDQAARMVAAGAVIIDIGGESTRPGAGAVAEQQELDRVMPVLEAVRDRFEVIASIDTSKPGVMQHAAMAGAGLLNDVRALREPGALEAAAASSLPVCLMHMQGQPRDMQIDPDYGDVVAEVERFLRERCDAAVAAGIDADQLLVDPGFGFGKTFEHNRELFGGIDRLAALAPVVVGVSRKRMIGQMLGDDSCDRTIGSAVAATLAVRLGASIVRVHDVAATVQALAVLHHVDGGAGNG